jgi:hypothetical protein
LPCIARRSLVSPQTSATASSIGGGRHTGIGTRILTHNVRPTLSTERFRASRLEPTTSSPPSSSSSPNPSCASASDEVRKSSPQYHCHISRQEKARSQQYFLGPSASSRNPSHDPPLPPPQPSAQSQPTSRPQPSSSSRRSHCSKSAARSETRTTLHTASASADMVSFRG